MVKKTDKPKKKTSKAKPSSAPKTKKPSPPKAKLSAPKANTAPKPKAKPAPKQPPKAAPRSVVKAPEEIEGERPLSLFDLQFCQAYVSTGKQAEAYRQLCPEAKDPHVSAHRMMQRPEIREHIRAIFRQISKDRQLAVQVAARASLLSLEVADDRLMEIMQTRRKTRGEMLSKDVKQLLIGGAVEVPDDDGNPSGQYALSPELKKSLEDEGAPVEDADLLKAIKLTYERKQGIIKAEKAPEVGPIQVMLYRPKWFGSPQPAKTIEAAAK